MNVSASGDNQRPAGIYSVEVRVADPARVSAKCAACRSSNAIVRFVVEPDKRILGCGECGLGWLDPLPAIDELARLYPPDYYGDLGAKFSPLVELLVRVVSGRRAQFLLRGLPRGGRVLDYGCGRGTLLHAFSRAGFEAHGVEMSANAVEDADLSAAEIRIASQLSEAGYDENSFDCVVIWHVLEHLTNPRETLQEAARILKPGGRLVVAVPHFGSLQSCWTGAGWFHLDPPRHLFHFSLEALRCMLADAGFVVRTVHHFSLRYNPFGWVQSILNCIRGLPRNGLYEMLLRSKSRSPRLYTTIVRVVFRLAWYLGMPAAVLLSVLAAGLRSGATIHVVAERVTNDDG